jgi:hypothetical protein
MTAGEFPWTPAKLFCSYSNLAGLFLFELGWRQDSNDGQGASLDPGEAILLLFELGSSQDSNDGDGQRP